MMKHIAHKHPWRYPAPTGIIEKALSGVGSVFRTVGAALDEFGAMVQGSAALRETVQPSLAWVPTQQEPDSTPQQGKITEVPPVARMPALSQLVMPVKDDDVFIAPSANVLGDVSIGYGSSIWYNAVLRGDVNGIKVGNYTNIQDNVVVHVSKHTINGEKRPTIIGDHVTVGHGATLHACTVGDSALIGMGATVLDGCVVGKHAIVGAGALLAPGTTVPEGEVWVGSPARKLRPVEDEEKAFIEESAINYADLADAHKFENSKCFEEQYVENVIIAERALASDPTNTVHQMFVYDSQTMLPVRQKK